MTIGINERTQLFLDENPHCVPSEHTSEDGEPLWPISVLKEYAVWLVCEAAAGVEFGILITDAINEFLTCGFGTLSSVDERYVDEWLKDDPSDNTWDVREN